MSLAVNKFKSSIKRTLSGLLVFRRPSCLGLISDIFSAGLHCFIFLNQVLLRGAYDQKKNTRKKETSLI